MHRHSSLLQGEKNPNLRIQQGYQFLIPIYIQYVLHVTTSLFQEGTVWQIKLHIQLCITWFLLYLLLQAHLLLNEIFFNYLCLLGIQKVDLGSLESCQPNDLFRVMGLFLPYAGQMACPSFTHWSSTFYISLIPSVHLLTPHPLPYPASLPELLPARSFAIVLPDLLLPQAGLFAHFHPHSALSFSQVSYKIYSYLRACRVQKYSLTRHL